MAVCLLAIWRGRDYERLAAAAVLADWALSMMVFKSRSEDTQWAVLLVDFSQFAVLIWIALRSRRFWPLFMGGFALLQILTHLAHAMGTGVTGWAYLTATRAWSYLILLTIAYGAWTAPRHAVSTEEPIDAAGATRR
jgi:hypothetical protein